MNKKELIIYILKSIFFAGGISGWILLINLFGFILFINLVFFLVSTITPLIYITFWIIEKIIIINENKIKMEMKK